MNLRASGEHLIVRRAKLKDKTAGGLEIVRKDPNELPPAFGVVLSVGDLAFYAWEDDDGTSYINSVAEEGDVVAFSPHESECIPWGDAGTIHFLHKDRVYGVCSLEDAAADGVDVESIEPE